MGHKNKIDLYTQVRNELKSQLRIGQSKHADKAHGAKMGIYSWSTYHAYTKHCCYFIDFVKSHKVGKVHTLADCKPYIVPFLQSAIDRGLSVYTIKLQAAALAKLYHCSFTDFGIELPTRRRENIKRSRGTAVRDRNFNEDRHKEIVEFCKATGLRRSELSCLRGTDLVEKDGRFYAHITRGAKGGRERYAPIVASKKELTQIFELMRCAGEGKVFSRVSSNMDVHHYRAEYAKRVYEAAAKGHESYKYERLVLRNTRPLFVYDIRNARARDYAERLAVRRDIKIQSNAYICRNDLARKTFVRSALYEVSKALGHNRVEVCTRHYLY